MNNKALRVIYTLFLLIECSFVSASTVRLKSPRPMNELSDLPLHESPPTIEESARTFIKKSCSIVNELEQDALSLAQELGSIRSNSSPELPSQGDYTRFLEITPQDPNFSQMIIIDYRVGDGEEAKISSIEGTLNEPTLPVMPIIHELSAESGYYEARDIQIGSGLLHFHIFASDCYIIARIGQSDSGSESRVIKSFYIQPPQNSPGFWFPNLQVTFHPPKQ